MQSEAFERFYAEEVSDVKSSWKIALTVIYIFRECWKAGGVTLSTTVLLKDTDVIKQPTCWVYLEKHGFEFDYIPLFFFSPIFRSSSFSSLNFSLYANNLGLSPLRRTSLREQSYVIHNQWPITRSLSHPWVICAAEKAKRGTEPFCSGFTGQGEGIMVFTVLLEVREQRLGIIWQMKLCVKRGQGCWVN